MNHYWPSDISKSKNTGKQGMKRRKSVIQKLCILDLGHRVFILNSLCQMKLKSRLHKLFGGIYCQYLSFFQP